MYKSRLFGKKWNGGNRPVYGLENRNAQQSLGISQRYGKKWRNGSQLPAMDVQVWQRGDFSFRDCQYRRDANLLWLPETEYPVRDQSKPGLAITAWVQYMLDNFATVDEAVAFIDENTFQVVSDLMPDGSRLATLHLSISDATGDCAIFEYTGGKLTVYHSKEYKVMTNSPTYNKQLALNEYWKSIGGLSFLPGTNRPSDRFARASFYINALPQTDDVRIAIASVFSVIRNTSVPYGISTPEFPEISTTQWRTVSDSKNLLYFFESSLTPNTFWVNLRETDLSEGAPVLKLSIANGETYHGNATKEFKPAQPFRFMGVKG